MLCFAVEITAKTVVDEDYKYSFFFWLDIIATITLVIDIPWLWDPFTTLLLNTEASDQAVNVIPGLPKVVNESKITNLAKSLRLIRLIRILKIYKYLCAASEDKEDDKKSKKKKKKQVDVEKKPEEGEETLFMIETNPIKIGKQMSETLNK